MFRLVLGEDAWHRLAPAIRRHYDMPPTVAATQILHGVMEEVYHAPWIKPWLLLARFFDALVPYAGRDVPVEVVNRTDPAQPDNLFWHRTFRFADGRTALFSSRMEPGRPGEIVELLRFGVGIRMAVAERDGALVFTARDHCWKIGPHIIGIPNWALLGDAVIVERALSDGELRLDFDIVHPWFGRTFAYRGRFTLPSSR
ncbi:DUF4166 domain-containing protein [Methylogaea oryzae]|uniref:DUF4166 domain-containing protein n=1 Tax=Methylogaea oryzae TaxID=1295382 RepID=UPI0012E26DCD|nr:DUF4166 domain-containing protein [Methylogaea oryzae]